MSTTLSDKIVKIRKDHVCFSCLRKFPKGTKMRYWAGIFEGDFSAVYYCDTCEKIFVKLPSEDGIPEGYVREMLNKDQTPEQFLEELLQQKN